MLRKEFDKKDIEFIEVNEKTGEHKVHKQIPEYVIENNELLNTDNNYVSYAISYRFETYKTIKYLAVTLDVADDFVFEKFYAMNPGFNDELLRMLERTRAIRLSDGTVDFSRLLYYNFQFRYKKYKNQNSYRIYHVEAEEDTYPENILAFYDPDTIFDDLHWKDLEEGKEFIGVGEE